MNKEQYNDILGQLIQLAVDNELSYTITERGVTLDLPRPVEEPTVVNHIEPEALENEDDN